MESLIELDRRISKAIERGKGMRFSDEELDLLVSVGAVEVLKRAAAEALKMRAVQRQQERDKFRALTADPSNKENMQEAVRIAKERATEILRRPARVPRSFLSSGESSK